jgi:hypothetical protein
MDDDKVVPLRPGDGPHDTDKPFLDFVAEKLRDFRQKTGVPIDTLVLVMTAESKDSWSHSTSYLSNHDSMTTTRARATAAGLLLRACN